MVSGQMTKGGESSRISGGKLRGNDLAFKVDGVSYTCRAEGNTLKGTVENKGRKTAWTAQKQK
jgi:hypothetical protein